MTTRAEHRYSPSGIPSFEADYRHAQGSLDKRRHNPVPQSTLSLPDRPSRGSMDRNAYVFTIFTWLRDEGGFRVAERAIREHEIGFESDLDIVGIKVTWLLHVIVIFPIRLDM